MQNSTNSTPKKGHALTRRGQWKEPFLKELGHTGNVTLACKAAAIDPKTAYNHKKKFASFAEKWNEALEQAADLLEAEARRRAVEGVDEPVFGSGGPGKGTVQIGTVRKYSDVLLMFLLKGLRPAKFRDHYQVKQNNQQNKFTMNWDEFLRMSQEELPPKQVTHVESGNSHGSG
jgi:hypothetical protein